MSLEPVGTNKPVQHLPLIKKCIFKYTHINMCTHKTLYKCDFYILFLEFCTFFTLIATLATTVCQQISNANQLHIFLFTHNHMNINMLSMQMSVGFY